MGNKLSEYECIRLVRLILKDKAITNIAQNVSSDLSNQNLETLNIKNSDSDQETIITIPPNRLEGDISLVREYNMLDELTVTVRADQITATVKGSTTEEPYFPLIDPYLVNKLEIDALLGYKVQYPDKLIRFKGLLTSISPQLLADGRIMATLTFYDKGFDMCRTVRQHSYPSIETNIDGVDPNKKEATNPKDSTNTIDETPDEFKKRTANSDFISQKMTQPSNRTWAKRSNDEELSLFTIVSSIIEGNTDSGGRIGGYGFKLQISDEVKNALDNVRYSHDNPLRQDNLTDWEFLRVELNNRGYTMARFIEATQYTIQIEGRDTALENTTEGRFRFVFNRPGQLHTDYNPFLLADTASSPTAINSTPSPKQNINNTNRQSTGFHNFVIEGDLGIEVAATGLYAPNLRTYTDDEGKPHIVSLEKNDKGDTIEVEYIVNEDLVDQRDEEGRNIEYLLGIAKGTYSFEDARAEGLIIKAVVRDSNDTNNEGFKSFPRAGWSCNFNTVGNPYALVGKWYWINGLGANYSQRWELRTITHIFSHKWTTNYALSR